MPLTPLDRKAEMIRRGVRQMDIAEALGVTSNHVSVVVRGERRSRRVERAVADALGMPVDDVFPAFPSADSGEADADVTNSA